MSTNFYELLKYAATGIAAPEMTAYDKMRALAAFGGGKVQTLTGQPPLSFKSNGTPLISWSMLGNGQQDGTPTPDAPIMPEFVGVRTGNLFDVNGKNTANGYVDYRQLNSDGSISVWGSAEISEYMPIVGGETYSFDGIGSYNAPAYCFYGADKQYISGDNYRGRQRITFVAPSNAKYFRFTHIKMITNAMCNLGSTILPYEPYGYKISLTCAGQTTPVYIGEVPTVRRVRKLVLTGEENWTSFEQSDVTLLRCADRLIGKQPGLSTDTMVCTVLRIADGRGECASTPNSMSVYNTQTDHRMVVNVNGLSVQDWQTYLQQQYAAGTPVTVWYVLAEPTTGVSNEPLSKISDYADELSSTDAGVSIPTVKGSNTLTVETELQPSEMTITYKE